MTHCTQALPRLDTFSFYKQGANRLEVCVIVIISIISAYTYTLSAQTIPAQLLNFTPTDTDNGSSFFSKNVGPFMPTFSPFTIRSKTIFKPSSSDHRKFIPIGLVICIVVKNFTISLNNFLRI